MPNSHNRSGCTCDECDLKTSAGRFQDLADLLPQIIFELDENLKFTFFNWHTIGITGYAYDELSKNRAGIFDILQKADHEAVRQFFAGLLQDITSGHLECRLLTHDGREIPALIYASPIIGEKRIAGIHGVIVDISEKVELEKALEATNQKLNMMNSVTRHDVLNSITGALGLCDMLAATTTDKDAKELVSEIRDQVVRMKEQILFTRDYQSVGVKAPQWQCLVEGIRHAVATTGRHTAQIHLPETDVEIYADTFFGRVFYNLIDNSYRHGESIRNIWIDTGNGADGNFIIRYRDDGTGIPPGEKEKVFEQGFGKNTGFGLFFIREVLGITGMSIRETGVFGSGVCFEITVPKTAWRPSDAKCAHDDN